MGIAQLGGGGCAVRNKCFTAGWNVVAKPCDYCKSAAALLFCRVDVAFMCMACDAKVHGSKTLGLLKHERVWMCEVCEQAPAAVTCKADAAALCVTCDSDIHCANPLARRHERVPVVPFYETAESVIMKSTAATLPVHIGDSSPMDAAGAVFASVITDHERKLANCVSREGCNVADGWASSNLIGSTKLADVKPMEFLLSDSDQFLDFDIGYQISSQPYSDSLVPVQAAVKPPAPASSLPNQSPENQFEIDFKRSNINSFHHHISYSTPSLSHSISSSSMEVGVVPDGSSFSEISYPFAISMLNVDLNANQGSQVVGMDREARVLRYREKRKNRKFEKTIRYASRKAYAETRPRIKGRFAKRTDGEADIDRFFDAGAVNLMKEAHYGVVPSFDTWDRLN